ncbi:MAG TPA: O-antigen ligase family protein [Caulobacteraceae bacterium]
MGLSSRATRLPRPASATAVILSLLIFAEIGIYGANRTDLALAFAAVWFAVLALMLLRAGFRKALEATPLALVAIPFGLSVAVCALAMTPFAPGGPHPVWRWVAGGPSVAAIDPYATLIEIIKLLALAAAFLIGVLVGRDDERAKAFVRSLLVVGIAYAGWALVAHSLNIDFSFNAARIANEPLRLSATLQSANTAATLFGALMMLNLADLERKLERTRSGRGYDFELIERTAPALALPVIGFATAVSCLTLTVSRSGLAIALGLCVVLFGLRGFAQARRGGFVAPVIAVIVILGGITLTSLALNVAFLGHRLSFVDASLASRQTLVAAHWSAFEASPWSGYGLGSFARIDAKIMNHANLAALYETTAAHNVYVQWLEEAGILGATPMFVCVALIVWQLMIGVVRRTRMRTWLIGILAVTALFLLHGITDSDLEIPGMATFFALLLGVGYAIAAPRRRVAEATSRGDKKAASATPAS